MTKAKRVYDIGDKVTMSRDALENYGEQYRGHVFTVEQWYDHYAKVDHTFDKHGHPGYDPATNDCLYHLAGLNFDLYSWELNRV